MAFSIQSSAFSDGAEIPKQYTGLGVDKSPPLTWSDPPAGTRSLALVVDDPDAPDPAAPKRVFTHWVLYNVPADAGGLEEGLDPSTLPEGTRAGINDFEQVGWNGPKPPIGRHRYFFKLYALDQELPELERPTKRDLERAMQGHVLAETELVGTYAKS
jgi:Raf kinase inhibitor-like YbhB/YbcL family protein